MTTENTSKKSKITSKQVVAMLGVIVLVLMYLLTLFFAIFAPETSRHLFTASLIASFCIPFLIWIYVWLYGIITHKKTFAAPEYNIGANPSNQTPSAEEGTREEVSAPTSDN